jgi:hypothetical protein
LQDGCKSKPAEVVGMADNRTLAETLQLYREADRLREAKYNLEALMGLATEVPILEPYVDTFSEVTSALKDRLREIVMDDTRLSEVLTVDQSLCLFILTLLTLSVPKILQLPPTLSEQSLKERFPIQC